MEEAHCVSLPCPPSRLNENISFILKEYFQDYVSYCDLYKILCKCVYLGHCVFGLRYKDELNINEYASLNIHKDNYLIH